MGFLLVLTFALFPQAPATTADAPTFLNNVTHRYTEARSYHIEAIVETSTSNELYRNWQKNLLKAIVAPGGRYRYEGRSAHGSSMLVSNGTKEWNYHADEHQYTEAAAAANASTKNRIITMEEMPAMEAKQLVAQLQSLSARIKSASFLPDEKLDLDGHMVECRVIHFTDTDLIIRRPGEKTEGTVWVDKLRNVIVKTASHGGSFVSSGGSSARIPIFMETTTVYPIVQLDEQEPETAFTFSPPADARLVAAFFTPFDQTPELQAARYLAKPAPEIKLKRDGEEIPLSSYRGKPVLLDFWDTWCGPCLAITPDLKKLYAETATKGLVWLAIDDDQDASVPATFIKQQQIPWPNYHDEDGDIGRAFGREGVPLAVLIDPQGKVVFYRYGYDMAELRAAIAKLGREFSSVAAAPAKTPAGP
jgi:thiol-disulfide isomerase/thioredoxin/outer membrane lipoprotein-sorting protein